MELRTVYCPACGKELYVPENTDSLFCNYCGAKISLAPEKPDVQEDPADAGQPKEEAGGAGSGAGGASDGGADYRYYYDEAIGSLTDNVTAARDVEQNFSKAHYPEAFSRYYSDLCYSLNNFDRAFRLYDGDGDELARQYAREFGGRIRGKATGQPKLSFLYDQETEKCIYLYVAFAVPAVLEFRRPYSETMADALLETWNADHPKRKIGKANYEMINGSFKKKFCFITTAVCESFGKADDCYELTAFRAFRDGYLSAAPGGREQIREYYLVAPQVVAAIDASPRRKSVYREIWERHLAGCLRLCEEKRYEECRAAYTDMVGELRGRWL